MESDGTLSSALAALDDITAFDLDDILTIETLKPTQTNDIMGKNREDLSSQISDLGRVSDTNLSDILTSFEEIPENILESHSVLHTTNDIETIEIKDSGELDLSIDNIKNNDFTFSQKSLEISQSDHLKTDFDREFEKLDDMDFEIPSFEEDTTITTNNEIGVDNNILEETLDLNKHRPIKSCTQLPSAKNYSSKHRNVSASCPNFIKVHHNSTITSREDEKNTMDFLELSYSASSGSEPNRESSMDFLEIIQSSQSSSENHSYETIIDSNKITKDNANGTRETGPRLNCGQDITNSTTDATAIPSTVKQLYDLMKEHYSDFSFVYALSAQLCQDRIPMGCFVNVKMSLLLSIASIGKNPDIPPIPIIVMGNDPYMANYLITSIADLADRFVGPVDDTKPPSSEGFCNRSWIEADPIQLAKGGVFYVGEWTCLKTQRSEKIFKDIETSRVAVERTTKIYSLQTAIWAHWRALKYNSKDQQIFNKFVKIFGIPVYMDDSNYESLVDYTLKQASVQMFESTIDHLSISSDDMRKLLATIAGRTVDFTPEAIDLLQKYFVASRTERPDCLTKQAFTILKQLAESFAKLSLRHEVLTIDAIGAIFLCEHFIYHLYGIGVDPPPTLESAGFVGNVDAHVAKFHDWLKSYISKYGDKY